MPNSQTISTEYQIKGKPLICPICGSRRFQTRRTLLNTPAMTFFSLEWANKRADNYICDECGHILWFLTDK